MNLDEAWQMVLGNTTPEQAAAQLGGKTPAEYVAAVVDECVAACAVDEPGLREHELRASLAEHVEEMEEMIRVHVPVTIEVALDSPSGPVVRVYGDADRETIEAVLPEGWVLGEEPSVKMPLGGWSYPLTSVQ